MLTRSNNQNSTTTSATTICPLGHVGDVLGAVCGKRTPAAIRHPRVRSRRPLKPRAGKCAVQAQREKSRIRWFARFSLVHESTLQSWWWGTGEIFLKEERAEKLGWKASKNKPRRPLPFPGMISIKLTPQCAPRCIGVPWWLQIQGVFLTGAPLKITSFFSVSKFWHLEIFERN